MMGMSHSIILLVWACCGLTDGVALSFCIKNMEPPTRSGSSTLYGALFWLENLARSMPMNVPSRGTAPLT